MQVYKTFFKISLRFFSSVIIYMVIFAVLSFATLGANTSDAGVLDFVADKIDIAVIDRDNTELSKDLYNYLNENHNIEEIGTDKETLADELYYRNVVYVLIIEDGFMENVLTGNYKNTLTSYEAPDSNSAFIVADQIETYIKTLRGYLSAKYELTKAMELTNDTIKITADVEFGNSKNEIASIDNIGKYFTYLPYILICMLINSLGPMLIAWNKPQIRKRTAISSKSLFNRTTSLIMAAITYSIFVFGVLIIFAMIAFRQDFFSTRGLIYLLNAVAFLIVSAALTFLVSQFCKRTEILNVWSNVLGLAPAFLSGIFVERSLLPDGVVSFSKCLPTYYYVSVTEELRFFNGTISDALIKNILIQLLFAAAIFVISLVVVKLKEKDA